MITMTLLRASCAYFEPCVPNLPANKTSDFPIPRDCFNLTEFLGSKFSDELPPQSMAACRILCGESDPRTLFVFLGAFPTSMATGMCISVIMVMVLASLYLVGIILQHRVQSLIITTGLAFLCGSLHRVHDRVRCQPTTHHSSHEYYNLQLLLFWIPVCGQPWLRACSSVGGSGISIVAYPPRCLILSSASEIFPIALSVDRVSYGKCVLHLDDPFGFVSNNWIRRARLYLIILSFDVVVMWAN